MKYKKIYLPSFLILLVLSLLISLGFWQLDRADDKKLILDAINFANSKNPQQIFNTKNLESKEHYKVLLTGKYLDKNFIYDNQTINGIYGYFVITPFILTSGEVVLVNRGFKAWGGGRKLPKFKADNNVKTIQVVVKKPILRIKLKNTKNNLDFPIIMQSLDYAFITKILKTNINKYIFLLGKKESFGFIRDWKPFYGTVEKHIGYAIQWFAMALVLFIIAIILFRKNKLT